MDNAISATWYDLPKEGREDYLSWLHEVHIPKVLKRNGYLWATHIRNVWDEEREKEKERILVHTDDPRVPDGNDYLFLFGAEMHIEFVDTSSSQLKETRSKEENEMLSLRIGERSCIFMVQDRIEGMESSSRSPGITPGPAIQIGTFNVNSLKNEEELSSWYAQVRMPRLKKMEGCVGCLLYTSPSPRD